MSITQKPQNITNNHKGIVTVTGILLLTLAFLSFVLSFNSLTDLAREHGVSIPQFIPLIIEGGMIVFSLSALVQNLQGQKALWQWALIIVASLTAMILNIIHAQAGDIVGQVLHAIPSIILLVGFESFLSQLKSHVKTAQIIKTYDTITQDIEQAQNELHHTKNELDTVQSELGELEAELSKLTSKRNKLKAQVKHKKTALEHNTNPNDTNLSQANDTRKVQMEARRTQVLHLLNDTDMSQSDIAKKLNVSLATIKRDTKMLNGQVQK